MFVIANVISKQALGDWGLETFTAHRLTLSWLDGSLCAAVNPCWSCKEVLLLIRLQLSLLFGRSLFVPYFFAVSSFVPTFTNTLFYCDGKCLRSSCGTLTNISCPSTSDRLESILQCPLWRALCTSKCFCILSCSVHSYHHRQRYYSVPLALRKDNLRKAGGKLLSHNLRWLCVPAELEFSCTPFLNGRGKNGWEILFVLWDPSKSAPSHPSADFSHHTVNIPAL